MTIEEYAYSALKVRTGIDLCGRNEVFCSAYGGDLCRIILSCGALVVFCREDIKDSLIDFLHNEDVKAAISSPDFYLKVLNAVGLDHALYPLEPYIDDGKKYKSCHTVEYVCSRETFKMPHISYGVKIIHKDEPDYMIDDCFSEIYAVTDGEKIVSTSYYRPNTGEFSGTNAMDVWTHRNFRTLGYGKAVAAAATGSIVNKNNLALWVSYAENMPSRRIAERLGYSFIGGELRIKE